MDFAEALARVGLEEAKLPTGVMAFLTADQYKGLHADAARWARDPLNAVALVYEVETEERRGQGLILRNLHDREDRRHLMLPPRQKPFFHNLTPALKLAWPLGAAVLCEGPKDARVLHQADIPAVAYLGSAPSREWLRVLARYVHSVLYAPDNDIRPNPEVARRQGYVPLDAAAVGLGFRTITLRAKDAGDLWDRPDELGRIRDRLHEVAALGGGGYRGAEPATEPEEDEVAVPAEEDEDAG